MSFSVLSIRHEAICPCLGSRLCAGSFFCSPAYAGSHSCQAVEECAAGVLRSLGEGGHASAGSAEDTKGTTAVKPWGSTRSYSPRSRRNAVVAGAALSKSVLRSVNGARCVSASRASPYRDSDQCRISGESAGSSSGADLSERLVVGYFENHSCGCIILNGIKKRRGKRCNCLSLRPNNHILHFVILVNRND